MFRIDPAMPPAAYQTFQISSPLSTHWRPATCAEVDCEHYLNGWRVPLAVLSEKNLHDIKAAGLRFRRMDVSEHESYLVFEAGQPCFRSAEHRLPLGRPELFIVKGGDWRGDPTGQEPYRHKRAEDWVDQFANHQDRLHTLIERG